MGTNGTNKFSDYPGTPDGSGEGKAGGAAGADGPLCERVLENVTLEEVGRCPYFERTGVVPAIGTPVDVRATLVEGRIAVGTSDEQEVIGYLPTEYTYLRRCMEQGYAYGGEISSSSAKPIPTVRVDLGGSR